MQAGAVLVQAWRHVIGVDARDIEGRGTHELLLGPARQCLVGTGGRGGIESGRGHAPFQLARDQVGVAPDVGAFLQDRRAAIAAGQRLQLGFGRGSAQCGRPTRPEAGSPLDAHVEALGC